MYGYHNMISFSLYHSIGFMCVKSHSESCGEPSVPFESIERQLVSCYYINLHVFNKYGRYFRTSQHQGVFPVRAYMHGENQA